MGQLDCLLGLGESKGVAANTSLDDLVQSNECATTDEEDVLGIDLDVFLVRMLAATLWRDVADRPFQNLQQSLLHPFSRNVAGDAGRIALAPNFIDLIDVNDAEFGALYIIIGTLQQPQDDILNVFAHITCLGQRRGVRDAKWHIKDPCERPRQQRLSRTRRPDQQDVALLDLHIAMLIQLDRAVGRLLRTARILLDAFVMIVHRHRDGLLGLFLSDHILVELPANLRRHGKFVKAEASRRLGLTNGGQVPCRGCSCRP